MSQPLKYQEAGISGKFRLLHKAHTELLLRATGLASTIHIFIVDMPHYKRYSTIEELKQAFSKVFQKLGHTSYQLHVINQELQGEQWDEHILQLAPNIEVMFDSKEIYGNILIKNDYIELIHTKSISATSIEENPLDYLLNDLIAPEFRPYLNKKIAVSGIGSSGKTMLTKKLADLYNTTYSHSCYEYYSSVFLGTSEDTYLPKDFVHISMEQTLQDKRENLQAKRFLFVDTDPIVILFKMMLYKQKHHQWSDALESGYQRAIENIETVIITHVQSVNMTVYIYPEHHMTDSVKKQENEMLLDLYQRFNCPIEIIRPNNYDKRFLAAIACINNQFNIIK